MLPKWKSYLNKPLLIHSALASSLKDEGYRPIAIHLYTPKFAIGHSSEALYSSVWIQRTGPDWNLLHYGDKDELVDFVAAARAKASPFWPRLITASGITNPRFAVLVEQGGSESSVEVGVRGAQIEDTFTARRDAGEFPRSMATYGVDVGNGGNYSCAFVWEKQPHAATYYFNGFSVAVSETKAVDEALLAGFSRVDHALPYEDVVVLDESSTTTRRYFLLYRNDLIPGVALATELSSSAAARAIGKARARGKWPIRIQATGDEGPDQRFAIVFADFPHDREPERSWIVMRPKYPATAGVAPWMTFSFLEDAFERAMKRWSVYAGQLAVAYQGRLVYAAGFTWAPPGYPVTAPTVRFRFQSISKTVTALAFCQLWDRHKLSPFPPYPDNNIARLLKRTFKDKRFERRHCGQLLAHLGRFAEQKILEETYPERVAADLGVPMPITMANVVDWIAQNMDDAFTQGEAPEPGGSPLPEAQYCGVGYTMLAQICAEAYAEEGIPSLDEGVRKKLFAPVGVSRPRKTTMNAKTAHDNAMKGEEVLLHARVPAWWYSQQGDGKPAPVAYEPTNSDVYLGNGSWAMSCPDYARLLSAFDEDPNPLFEDELMPQKIRTEQAKAANGTVWYRGFVKRTFANTLGESVEAMWHNGSGLGGSAVAFRREDRIVIVYAWNTDVIGFPDTDANSAVNKVLVWP